MSSLHVVIIGGSATKDSIGQTPEPDDIDNAISLALKHSYKPVFHLVDPLYIRTLRKLENGSDIIDDMMEPDVNRLNLLLENNQVMVIAEKYKDWENEFLEEDFVVYICYVEEFDPYQIMALVNSFQMKNRWFYSKKGRLNITQLIADWIVNFEVPNSKNFFSYEIYDIFKGDRITKISTENLESVKKYYAIACRLLVEYIEVGFHEKRYKTGSISSWTLNVEVLPLRGFIDYYGLHSTIQDMKPWMEIKESASYRLTLTNIIISVLGNFCINHNLITAQQVAEVQGGWYSTIIWKAMEKSISSLERKNLEIVVDTIDLSSEHIETDLSNLPVATPSHDIDLSDLPFPGSPIKVDISLPEIEFKVQLPEEIKNPSDFAASSGGMPPPFEEEPLPFPDSDAENLDLPPVPDSSPPFKEEVLPFPDSDAEHFDLPPVPDSSSSIVSGEKTPSFQVPESKDDLPPSSRITFEEMVNISNPDFVIKSYKASPRGKRNFTIKVIDESIIVGGSSQRFISKMFFYSSKSEYIFVTSGRNYYQIALAYCCLLAGKKLTIFVDSEKENSAPETKEAEKFGAVIVYYDGKRSSGRFKEITSFAFKYQKENRSEREILRFDIMYPKVERVIANYRNSLEPLSKNKIDRIWLFDDDGVLSVVLSRIFPNSFLLIVDIDRKIQSSRLIERGMKKTNFEIKYLQKKDESSPSPYDSNKNFWRLVLENGKDGDYIFNSAGSIHSEKKIEEIKKNASAMLIDHYLKRIKLIGTILDMPRITSKMLPPEKMFENLKKYQRITDEKDENIVIRNMDTLYNSEDGLSNYFTEKERMNCYVNRGEKLSPIAFWEKYREKIVDEAYWNGGDYELAMYNLGARFCQTFLPSIMIDTIKRLFNEKLIDVLDPSMGWGDRLIAALAFGVKSYTGFDPNTDLHKGYDQIDEMFNRPINTVTKFYPLPFSSDILEGKQYDLVFTSPPYFDFEIYAHTEEVASYKYRTWLDKIYNRYVKDMASSTKINGYICLYLQNVGNNLIVNDTRKILIDSGFVELHNVVFKFTNIDYTGLVIVGNGKPLWIFKKIR